MNKAVRYILFGLVGVVVLLLAAVVLIPLFVDVNDFKQEIAAQVRERTGRELVFEGDISLHVFPRVALELGPMRMADDPAFGSGDFVRIRHATGDVDLLPMFSGVFQVGTLRLDGLVLNLAVDKDGWGNWRSLMGDRKPGATGQGADGAQGEAGDAFSLAGPEARSGAGVREQTLAENAPPPPASMRDAAQPTAQAGPMVSVQAIAVTDAAVRFTDQGKGAAYELTGFSLETGSLALDDAARFTDITLRCAVALGDPRLDAAITATAKANLDNVARRFEARDLDLAVAATGGVLPGGKANLSVRGGVVYDMASGAVSLHDFRLAAYGAALRATLAANVAASTVDGRIVLEPTDLRAVLAAMGAPLPAMADPKALTAVGAAMAVTASAERVALSDIAIDVDGAAITGSASVSAFDKPDIAFALAAPSLDADRYMPAKGGEGQDGAGKAPEPDASRDKDGGLDDAARAALRRLVLDGSVKVGRLKVSGVTATNIEVGVRGKDGVFKVAPCDLALYGGTVKTTLGADLRGTIAATDLGLAVAAVGVGDLIRDLTGQDVLSGAATLALTLKSRGEAMRDMVRTLTGGGTFSLRDGAFNGFRIVPEGTEKQLRNDAQRKTVENVAKRQPFKAITASFAVKDGVLSTNNLKLAADGLGATGGGSVNLAANTLDVQASVDMRGLPRLPVYATGALTDPSYGLDAKLFLKETVRGLVEVPVQAGETLLQGVGSALGLTQEKKAEPEEGGEEKKSGSDLLESIGNIFGGTKK
ncbi:MAG: AsmA family protein [Desulfovibrionaceae bacterium]